MKNKRLFIIAMSLLAVAVLFTILVKFVDVQALKVLKLESGEFLDQTTNVGFAKMNEAFRNAIKCNASLYKFTSYLGYLCFVPMAIFFVVGIYQWIKRKSFSKIDKHIIVLGVFYVVIILAYVFFDFGVIAINRRPIITGNEKIPEWSFPSSSTMLGICISVSTLVATRRLVKNKIAVNIIGLFCGIYLGLMVVGRLMSGVHWLSDIIGGVLFAAAFILIYYYFVLFFDRGKKLVSSNEISGQ